MPSTGTDVGPLGPERAISPSYHGSGRDDLLRLIPLDCLRVLDVGCGTGRLGTALKRRSGVRVTGIEMNAQAASVAASVLDRVLCAPVEEVSLPALDPPFDCIIFGDILEHTTDPWAVLSSFAEGLRPGGCVVASLPNVAHWTIIAGLLRGRWEYRGRGLLDRTHLRFFTRHSIVHLFAKAGLAIERWERNYRLHEADRRHPRLARRLARGPLRDLLTFQYLILARKKETER